MRKNTIENQVQRIREAVMEQWDRLSDTDMDTLRDTLTELQESLEKRVERTRKQARAELKPLKATVEEKREALDDMVARTTQQAGDLTAQAGRTVRTNPWMAAMAGVAFGLVLAYLVSRRNNEQY